MRLLERRRTASWRHELTDGAGTSVHMASYALKGAHPRVVLLDQPQRLAAWCADNHCSDAMIGGFFIRAEGVPLGELWVNGARPESEPFDDPWAKRRACVSVERGRVRVGPRCELAARPAGDLLQAGPLLVVDGTPAVFDGGDPEGFSSGLSQFDSDITVGRYPRAALGITAERLIALVCDGRSEEDAGLTLAELASLMAASAACGRSTSTAADPPRWCSTAGW